MNAVAIGTSIVNADTGVRCGSAATEADARYIAAAVSSSVDAASTDPGAGR